MSKGRGTGPWGTPYTRVRLKIYCGYWKFCVIYLQVILKCKTHLMLQYTRTHHYHPEIKYFSRPIRLQDLGSKYAVTSSNHDLIFDIFRMFQMPL